jgi:regulator of CtrA degradation
LSAPTFFSGPYDETMALLLEARAWIAYCEPRERQRLDLATGLRFSCETLRLTTRLTQAMAWLLTQRAVINGELTLAQMVDGNPPLHTYQAAMDHPTALLEGLPKSLLSLLERSHALYVRLARLDAGLRVEVAPAALEAGGRVGRVG